MPQNPQNKISQTVLKHLTEAIRWLQITTDTGIKLKFETIVKEKNQQILDLTTIDILKIEQQHPSGQYIINLPISQSSMIILINIPCH